MGLFSLTKLFGMTIRESANDGSDFTNPDADYRRLFLGEDGQLHVKDSAGTVTSIGGGVTDHGALTGLADDDHPQYATNAELDDHSARHESGGADAIKLDDLAAPEDNTDLNATTSAHGLLKKLDNDAAHFLNGQGAWAAVSSGALASGTSFPGSPSAGDRYRRTDIDYLVFVYDGTRWKSEQMFAIQSRPVENISATAAPTYAHAYGGRDVYIERLTANFYVATTNDGSKYWTMQLQKQQGAGAVAAVGTALSTQSLAANQWLTVDGAIGVVVTAATGAVLKVEWAKTSTPGNLYGTATIWLRLIAT